MIKTGTFNQSITFHLASPGLEKLFSSKGFTFPGNGSLDHGTRSSGLKVYRDNDNVLEDRKLMV